MTRQDLINELLAAPGHIASAEDQLHFAKTALTAAKDELGDAEARVLLEVLPDGTRRLNGKNAEERAAQLRQALVMYHEAVRDAERLALEAEREYERARNRFRAARSVAMLLSGDVEEMRLAA